MSNDLAIANLPQTFRENLREKVMAATLDLIPKEVLDSYINKEITAFFESPELLTVKETEITVDNPRWDSSKYTGYGNEREIKLKALAFGSNRTRFKSEAKLISGSVAERFKAAVLKTAVGVYPTVGSNPTASANAIPCTSISGCTVFCVDLNFFYRGCIWIT